MSQSGNFSTANIDGARFPTGNRARTFRGQGTAFHIQNGVLLHLNSITAGRFDFCRPANGEGCAFVHLNSATEAFGVGQRAAGHAENNAVRLTVIGDINACSTGTFHFTASDIYSGSASPDTKDTIIATDQLSAGNIDGATGGRVINIHGLLSCLDRPG